MSTVLTSGELPVPPQEKRKIYDRFGEEGLKQQQQNGAAGGGFNDPFEMFRNAFGGGGAAQRGERRGQNMLAEMEVSLEDIYKGGSLTVSSRSPGPCSFFFGIKLMKLVPPHCQFSISRKAICDTCDGSGARSDKDIVDCPTCDGRGVRLIRHQLGPGIFQQVQMHCDVCGGRGKKSKHVCSTCHGRRIVDATSELLLHIDRGMPEGAEVTFEGEADESPDLPAGDVIVRVRSRREQGGFIRKESNLYWKETISVAEVRQWRRVYAIVSIRRSPLTFC